MPGKKRIGSVIAQHLANFAVRKTAKTPVRPLLLLHSVLRVLRKQFLDQRAPYPAKVPKPQSDPAITRSAPTISTNRCTRCVTKSGCSTKFVVVSTTPGTQNFVVGDFGFSGRGTRPIRGRGAGLMSQTGSGLHRRPSRCLNTLSISMSQTCGPS